MYTRVHVCMYGRVLCMHVCACVYAYGMRSVFSSGTCSDDAVDQCESADVAGYVPVGRKCVLWCGSFRLGGFPIGGCLPIVIEPHGQRCTGAQLAVYRLWVATLVVGLSR